MFQPAWRASRIQDYCGRSCIQLPPYGKDSYNCILISKLTSSPALAAILQSRRQVYVSLSGDIMFYWRCKLRPRRNETDKRIII